MKDYTAGKAWKIAKQQRILEAAFSLFASRGIEMVTMPEVAEASGVARATLYRYFTTKLDLVVAVGTWKWEEYIKSYDAHLSEEDWDRMTGADYVRHLLNGFLDLYRNHGDILRFNYNFNSYLRYELGSSEQKAPYINMMEWLGKRFHEFYERGMEDGTLRTDISEVAIFSSTFHIMLATVTRYAVGLVYVLEKGSEPEKELVMLRDLLESRFVKEA